MRQNKSNIIVWFCQHKQVSNEFSYAVMLPNVSNIFNNRISLRLDVLITGSRYRFFFGKYTVEKNFLNTYNCFRTTCLKKGCCWMPELARQGREDMLCSLPVLTDDVPQEQPIATSGIYYSKKLIKCRSTNCQFQLCSGNQINCSTPRYLTYVTLAWHIN